MDLFQQDLDTLMLEDFGHNFANITGFRLINYRDHRVDDILQQMADYHAPSGVDILHSATPKLIKVQPLYGFAFDFWTALSSVYWIYKSRKNTSQRFII